MKKKEKIQKPQKNQTYFGMTPQNIHYFLNKYSQPLDLKQQTKRETENVNLLKQNNEDFNPLAYGHLGLDEKRAIIYKEIFDNFSSKKNDFMTPGEMRNFFEYLDIHTNPNEIFQVLCEYDTNELGYLDFEDFVKVITDRTKPYEQDNKRNRMEVFRQLTKRQQFITLENLEEMFFQYGFVLQKEDVEEIYKWMLNKFQEQNAEQEIDFFDFQKFDQLLLQMQSELNKEIMNNKF